jgi:oligogalacturonide transport system permease protein
MLFMHAAVPPSAARRRRLFTRQDIGLVYVCPWVIGFLIFTLYPMVCSLVYSFTEFNYLKEPVFVGWENFKRMFSDINFRYSMKATLTYVLFAVPLKLITALLLALLLNRSVRHIHLYRTVYYLPSILAGSVAIGVLWRLLFSKDGMINSLTAALGLPAVNWLGDPRLAIYVVSVLPIWQVGSSMVIFLAALKQVPEQLYEVARIDGAGPLRRFFKITLPMISPIMLFNLVNQTISSFQEFSSAFVVTGGGPVKTTYLYTMFIYDEAFQRLRMGYASALSWFLFILILIFTVVIFATSKKWTFYEDGGK